MVFPTSDLILRTSVFIGILVSMLWYEKGRLSPGGVIVPGYMALFTLLNPLVVVYTVLLALATSLIIRLASNYTILFGRRRFAITMLVGMTLAFALETFLAPFVAVQFVGIIIPGLIANEVHRQGPVPTLLTLGFVTSITAGATILLAGLW